jgi:lysylphosphatidylglycerol synthetase-like protein (DUF2156 family)
MEYKILKAYNIILYVTVSQRQNCSEKHILWIMVSWYQCTAHERIFNKDYVTKFSLSSEQTGSVISLVSCTLTTVCTHQHRINAVLVCTDTLKLCNNHCFPTTTMVARTLLNIKLYVHWLYYYKVNLFVSSLWRSFMYRHGDCYRYSADSFTADGRYQVYEIFIYVGGCMGWHIADVILQKTASTVPDFVLRWAELKLRHADGQTVWGNFSRLRLFRTICNKTHENKPKPMI